MKSRFRIAAASALLLAPLALAGCAVTPFVSFSNVAAAPVRMTSAGEYYLDTICPRNAAIFGFDDVRLTRDLATLQNAAAAASQASKTAAAGLRSPDAPWPSALQPQIELLAQSLDFDAISYSQVAAATTLQEAWAVPFPGERSAGDAKFVIRKNIGLADGQQYDDCVGHYGHVAAAVTGSTT